MKIVPNNELARTKHLTFATRKRQKPKTELVANAAARLDAGQHRR